MKLSRQLLKQLIAEERDKLSEMCGDVEPSSHMPDGNGVAVQHPSPAGSGDMSIPDNDPFAGGEMAMSQLVHLMQNAEALKGLVSDDDELQGWVRGKLGKAGDYLDSITKFLEFEMLPDQVVALELRENKIEFSKNDLKKLIAEEVLNESQGQPHIMRDMNPPTPGRGRPGQDWIKRGSPGGYSADYYTKGHPKAAKAGDVTYQEDPGAPFDPSDLPGMDSQSAAGGSTEDTLRSSIMSALDSLKGGSVEEAVGQLQAALDATTGGAGLDK